MDIVLTWSHRKTVFRGFEPPMSALPLGCRRGPRPWFNVDTFDVYHYKACNKTKMMGYKMHQPFRGAYWDINRSLSKRGKSNHIQWPFKNGEHDFPNHGMLGAKNSKLTWYFSCKSAPRPTADLQSPALMANGTHVGAHLAKIRRNETGRPIPWPPTAIGSVFNHNPGSKCRVSIFSGDLH